MTTKTRILRAAERLFAEKGIDNATLKMVTAAAGVNLAAVNYYFGSKDELVLAVFDDLADRLSQRRLALLAQRKLTNGGAPVGVDEIVYFFLEPYILHDGGHDGALLINMLMHQRVSPNTKAAQIITRHFDKVAHAYVEAFAAALPDHDKKTLFWRYHLMVSTILFAATERGPNDRMARLSDGAVKVGDIAELAHQLISFIAGGLAAPTDGRRLKPMPQSIGLSSAEAASAPARTTRTRKKTTGENDGQLAIRKRTARSR